MSFVDEAHLLIVSEDAEMRQALMKYLKRHGFWVTGARGRDHAIRLLEGLDFSLVVLDAETLGADAADALAALGGDESRPVVALTGKAQEVTTADALVKPFEPAALLDRVNRRLGRDTTAPPAPVPMREIVLGPIRYDMDRGEMWKGPDPVRLTATESLLMRIFAARPNEALSRIRLVRDLGRSGGQAQERAVDVQITRLRRKIEPDPKSPRYLQTVRGAGYLLSPD